MPQTNPSTGKHIWRRNLLFWGIVVAGVASFGATFLPSPERPRTVPKQGQAKTEEFQAVVSRIDAALQTDWDLRDLEPAPAAPDLAVIRRTSLALTGSIPSLEELRMLERVPEAERTTWWVSYLLADQRSADYIAERFARAYVGVNEGPFLLYRRRRFVTWLGEQIAADRPYDAIVRDLIASDGLWTDTPAVNFLTNTIKPDSDEGPNETILAARVARAFLGVRIDCAECHDHPFQEWKQADFHGLAAFFGTARQSFRGIADSDEPYELSDPGTGESTVVEPKVPFLPELASNDQDLRRRLARWVTHKQNSAFAHVTANRLWALMFGRPLVEPIDDIPLDRFEPVADSTGAGTADSSSRYRRIPGDYPKVLDILAADLAANGYDLKRTIRLIAASKAFHLDSKSDDPARSISEDHEAAWAAFPLVRLRPEQVVGSLLQSTSVGTIDYESHIVVRFFRAVGQSDFVGRYGDLGEGEFEDRGGTIPQRLLMMNGELAGSGTEFATPLALNSVARIALLARDDLQAVETAYLSVLTRRPTGEESAYFVARLGDSENQSRNESMQDLYWTLLNSTEFSWNHYTAARFSASAPGPAPAG